MASAATLTLVRADGATSPLDVTAPTTLRELLEGADVKSFEFDFLDIVGATKVRLTRAQALEEVPVIEDAGALRVGDVDAVRSVVLGEGSPLIVTGSADKSTVEAGTTVHFKATVAGLQDGEAARVRWTFPGGNRLEGKRVSLRFDKPGTYPVAVGATTKSNRSGAFDVIKIRVTKAEEPEPTPTPAATTPPTVGTGGGGTGQKGQSPQSGGRGRKGQSPQSGPTPVAVATAAPTPEGELVTGLLLGGPAHSGGGSAPQPAVTETRPDPDGGLSIPPGVIGAAAAALLAAAGFRLDMRRARPGWR